MTSNVGLSNADPVGLRVVVSERAATTTIQLEGEFDLPEQEPVRTAVSEALQRRPESLVLDLSNLSFIDSSGLHVVIESTRRAAEQQADLAIIPGPAAVQRVFEICGVADVLPFKHLTCVPQEPRAR